MATQPTRCVIITKKDSGISKISELKGKTVAFAASKSTSGNLIPRYLLANSGVHLNDLRQYVNFDYHDSVVKAILKGQYDAGSVRDSVARKYMKLGIETIAESEAIPTGPLVAGPKTPLPVIEDIKKALLELNPDNSSHRNILKRLDDDLKNGFIEAADNDYIHIRGKDQCGTSDLRQGMPPQDTAMKMVDTAKIPEKLKFFSRLSLQYKFILITTAAIVIFMFIIGYLAVEREKAILYTEVEREGRLLGETLAIPIINDLIYERLGLVEEGGLLDNYILEIFNRQDVNLLYIAIIDEDGKVMSHNDITNYGKVYTDPLTMNALKADHTTIQQFSYSGHKALDIGVPLSIGKNAGGL